MSDDLVKRLRAEDDDSFIATLSGEAADRIEALKAALAAMTAERDGYRDICDPWAFGSADPSEIGGK